MLSGHPLESAFLPKGHESPKLNGGHPATNIWCLES